MNKQLLGPHIKKLRLKIGLSQEKLAKKSGLSRIYIIGLERGRHQNPSVLTLYKLAMALNTDMSNIISPLINE